MTVRPFARSGNAVRSTSQAVRLLQLFAITAMVFPSDSVLKVVGGGGYVAALVAYFLFAAWAAVTLFGQHDPLEYRSPVRIALCGMWLASLSSYVFMNRAILSKIEQTGADRWLLQLVGVSGVILVASEFLRSIDDIHRVLRALVWAGAFCGLVAALQFWLTFDLSHYLRMLPGFSMNQADAVYNAIDVRSGLNRVAGTAIDPIELGVVAGMLLPLAVYLAINDFGRSRFLRWTPVLFIGLAVPTSVSRSAILSAGVALGVLIVMMPAARRLAGIGACALATVAVFVSAHHLIGTLKNYFLAGTSDNSIAHRVGNYPYVIQLVSRAPWLGQGGGTYIAQSVHILDNEYLTTAIQLGVFGLLGLAFYLIWPAVTAFHARRRATDTRLRDLCAALAGAELAAVLCSGTFDSLSFPMFVSVQALVVGLIGAAWLVINEPIGGRQTVGTHSARSLGERQPAARNILERTGGS